LGPLEVYTTLFLVVTFLRQKIDLYCLE
jgi:hypothetical protein